MRFASTLDPTLRTTFVDAVRTNVPATGGLYLPHAIEPFADVEALLAMPFAARSVEILDHLLAPELSRPEIERLVAEAFTFPLPLVPVSSDVLAFELWHGPTLSFKDVGVRFLAALLELLGEREGNRQVRTVLTATSGDTGAAVASAFHGRAGFRVAVLYPEGRISALQERQIATLGGNVRAFAVDGSFDDCQAMVKSAFADEALASELGLVSANSIHVARLLAQALYYFEAVARASDSGQVESGRPLVVAVPSGNFGNLYSGLLARALGAPIDTLVAATNANAPVPEHLESGHYRPRPSVATLSNAMDVGAPSNWERVVAQFDGDLGRIRAGLRWASIADDETLAEVDRLAAVGYRADPHGAVAAAALRRTLQPGERGVFLATAHPAKFDVTLDRTSPLPPALAEVVAKPVIAEPIPAEPEALRRRLAGEPAQPERTSP